MVRAVELGGGPRTAGEGGSAFEQLLCEHRETRVMRGSARAAESWCATERKTLRRRAMNEPLWRRRNPAVAPSYMAAAGSDVGYSARRRVPAYPSIIDPRFVVNLENDRDLSERLLEELSLIHI